MRRRVMVSHSVSHSMAALTLLGLVAGVVYYRFRAGQRGKRVVGLGGLEPPTSS
jgi:hypothetical protein